MASLANLAIELAAVPSQYDVFAVDRTEVVLACRGGPASIPVNVKLALSHTLLEAEPEAF
jgi:hypothetical protein